MATEEERREIARRLRKTASRNPAEECALGGCVFKRHDCSAYHSCRECLEDAYNRLAYLIDPETCRMEYDPCHNDYVCSKYGEFFDTATYGARNSDDEYVEKDFKHCPNCGRKVAKK